MTKTKDRKRAALKALLVKDGHRTLACRGRPGRQTEGRAAARLFMSFDQL